MTAIEKLIDAARHIVDLIIDDEGDKRPVLMQLKKSLEEYESTSKPWAPPWALKIPDDAEWLAVDEDGMGKWYDTDPEEYEHSFEEPVDGIFWYAGYFEIPPGVDWRDMKVRVR